MRPREEVEAPCLGAESLDRPAAVGAAPHMQGRHGFGDDSGSTGPLSPKNQPHLPAVWGCHSAGQAAEAMGLVLSPWGQAFPSTHQPGRESGRQLPSGPLAWRGAAALIPPVTARADGSGEACSPGWWGPGELPHAWGCSEDPGAP